MVLSNRVAVLLLGVVVGGLLSFGHDEGFYALDEVRQYTFLVKQETCLAESKKTI